MNSAPMRCGADRPSSAARHDPSIACSSIRSPLPLSAENAARATAGRAAVRHRPSSVRLRRTPSAAARAKGRGSARARRVPICRINFWTLRLSGRMIFGYSASRAAARSPARNGGKRVEKSIAKFYGPQPVEIQRCRLGEIWENLPGVEIAEIFQWPKMGRRRAGALLRVEQGNTRAVESRRVGRIARRPCAALV